MSRKFGGTGLGLVISRHFAKMLGGEVTVVESHEGVGTHFRATVAIEPADPSQMIDEPSSALRQARASQESTSDIPEKGLAGVRVLLAEDAPDNQRLISFVLRKAGAEVVVGENGKIAVELALAALAEKRPYDVILMDMQMPVMDGYAATALLRRESYQGAIIALTAHAMEGDRESCTQSGCDDYATKPIDRNSLIQTVARWAHDSIKAQPQGVCT